MHECDVHTSVFLLNYEIWVTVIEYGMFTINVFCIVKLIWALGSFKIMFQNLSEETKICNTTCERVMAVGHSRQHVHSECLWQPQASEMWT